MVEVEMVKWMVEAVRVRVMARLAEWERKAAVKAVRARVVERKMAAGEVARGTPVAAYCTLRGSESCMVRCLARK